MGFDDLVNKGKQAFEDTKEKIDETLKSEKAEETSDSVLDKVEGFAKGILPDSADEHIKNTRDNIDKHIGNE